MRVTTTLIILITLGLLAVPAAAQIHDARALSADPALAEGPIAPMLEGLGDYHFPIRGCG